MKNIKISEVFGLPVHVHKKDRSYTLFDQNIFKNGMVGLVLDISQCDAKEELAINAIATAINAYDTNQARIAELEGVLREITKEENIREIKDWVTCGMTNSVSASSDTGLIANKYNNFFDLISRATTLVSHRDIIKAAEDL